MLHVLAGGLTRRSLMLIAGEIALIAAAIVAGTWIRLGRDDTWLLFTVQGGAVKAVFIVGTCVLCFYYSNLYDFRRTADRREMMTRVLNGLGAASIALALIYFWFPTLMIGRGVFLLASGLVIVSLAVWRGFFEWFGQRLRPRERLLLVGTGGAAVTLAREMFERRHELGVEIVGFIDPDPARLGAPILNPGVIGTIEDIPSIARARGVDRVVVSLADARGKLPMSKLLDLKIDGMSFDHLATVYEQYTGKIAIENLRPSWLIFSSGFRRTAWNAAAKRAIDVLAALVGLSLAAPVMLAVAIAVKLTSRGPVLYHQERVGLRGDVFTLHKIRSMVDNAERGTGPVWAKESDARITPVGRFLRRSRLDELPQLWNVLVGDMSLVGPRPERPEFVEQLSKEIPFYGQRHAVRPGVTGWAQIRYRYGSSVEDALEKLQYDLFYIKHVSFAFDLFIIAATMKTVIQREGT